MKTKKRNQPVIITVSPIICNVVDDTGEGFVGFTANFTDGTFKNITLTFCPETKEAVQSKIQTIKQSMESSLVTIQAVKPQDNGNQTTRNSKKGSLT